MGYIGADSRAEACHDVPILRVFQDVWNKGPGLAHARLDRMNRTEAVFPENAVSGFCLSQNGLFPGILAVFFQEYLRIDMNKSGDGLNILWGNIGSAEALAAVAALSAVENILGRQ